MKVKGVYEKLREIDNYIDEIGDLIIATRTSGIMGATIGPKFLQTVRGFLFEYKNILEDMEIKEEE